MSKFYNTGGGGFLLNPPAPSAQPTSFLGLSGIQSLLSGCPQSTIPPCFRVHVNGTRTDNLESGLDTFLPGTWLLIGGRANPQNYYFFTRNFPIFAAKVNTGDRLLYTRWMLYYGRPRVESGPYYVPGGENAWSRDWYLVGMPGTSFSSPHRIYRLWGVENQDPDLEPVPDPPNDIVGEPPYDEENDNWEEYEEQEFYNYYRNFRAGGNDYTFNPLGSSWFRVVPIFKGLIRDSRVLERADHEFLRVEGFWP